MIGWKRHHPDANEVFVTQLLQEVDDAVLSYDTGPLGLKIVPMDIEHTKGSLYRHARRIRDMQASVSAGEKKPVQAADKIDQFISVGILSREQYSAVLSLGIRAQQGLDESIARPSLLAQGYSLYVNTLHAVGRLPAFQLEFADIWGKGFFDDVPLPLQLQELASIGRDVAPDLCHTAQSLLCFVKPVDENSSGFGDDYNLAVRTRMLEAGIGLAASQCYDFFEDCRREVLKYVEVA